MLSKPSNTTTDQPNPLGLTVVSMELLFDFAPGQRKALFQNYKDLKNVLLFFRLFFKIKICTKNSKCCKARLT